MAQWKTLEPIEKVGWVAVKSPKERMAAKSPKERMTV
jgi:hypothetical protein